MTVRVAMVLLVLVLNIFTNIDGLLTPPTVRLLPLSSIPTTCLILLTCLSIEWASTQ